MHNRIPQPAPYRGHAHFWERAMARRRFIQAALGGTALALGPGLGAPALADDTDPLGAFPPNPIPSGQQFLGPGTEVFHVFLGKGQENVTITDFNGAMAAAHILGTATQLQGGVSTALEVDHDLRFFKGIYVATDGKVHQGTFGFF